MLGQKSPWKLPIGESSMFFEFLNAAISLDLNWLATLFFSNFHYLFVFAALCFFFFGPSTKKMVVAAILFIMIAWLWVDISMMSGWLLFVGGFLGINYITKLLVMTFAEDMPILRNNLVIVSEVHFLTLLVTYNLFLR